MKKNKDIERQYLSFIKNLTLLLKESDFYFHEKIEEMREKDSSSKFKEALEQKKQNNIDDDVFKKELFEFKNIGNFANESFSLRFQGF